MTRLLFNRDLVGGAIIASFGVVVAVYAVLNYELGTLTFMGPGAFPMGAGVLLAFLGVLVALASLKNLAPAEVPQWQELVRTVLLVKGQDLARVALAIASFAVLIRPFGVIPAVAAITAISMVTAARTSWWQTLVVAAVISTFCIALFQFGLGLRIAAVGTVF